MGAEVALTLHPVPGKEKSRLICAAFAAGAPRHATGAVFFGTESLMQTFRRAQQGTWWYIDNSYFDTHRGLYFRATKNALQVDPRGKTSTGERFAKLGIKIHSWREHLGPDTLLCPQSEQFMKSTLGVDYDWTEATLAGIRTYDRPDLPVRVRAWNRDKKHQAMVLEDELPKCRLVVSHSSSASITAMLHGVPSISTGHTAAAYHLTGPLTKESFLNPPRPSDDERLRFCQVLADNQFTLEEFRNGVAWRWLENN